MKRLRTLITLKEVVPGSNDRKQGKNRGVLLKGLRMQGFLRGSGYE